METGTSRVWLLGTLLAAWWCAALPALSRAQVFGAATAEGGSFLRAKGDMGTNRSGRSFTIDGDIVRLREPADLHRLAVVWFEEKLEGGGSAVWYVELADLTTEVSVRSVDGVVRLDIPRAAFTRSASAVVPLALPDRAHDVSLNVAGGTQLPHRWMPGSQEVVSAFADLASQFQVFVTDPDVLPLQIARGAPDELARPLPSPQHLSFALAWEDRIPTWEGCRLAFVRQGERFFRLWQDSPLDRHVSLIDGILPLAGSIQGGAPATLIVAEPGLERFGRELAEVSNPPQADTDADDWEADLVPIDERYLWTRIALREPKPKPEAPSGWFRIVVDGQGSSPWRHFSPPEEWTVRMKLEQARVELLLENQHYGTAPFGAASIEVEMQQPRPFVLEAGPDLDLSISGYRVQLARGARPMDPWPTVLDGKWPESRVVSLQLPRAPGLELVLCLSDGETCRFKTVPIPDTLEQHTASFGR
ncbi:MAG: hypothetical protein GC161_08585 [Planctomycetaceae bacterium]|nr:hypothetical protein [Planctomycetaceae bacterium]